LQSYKDLLSHILTHGERVPSRAHLKSTGQNVDCISVFGHTWEHDMAAGFPLLTTKFVSITNILHELVWFMRGETNIAYLKKNGVNIWDQWADANGELGPVYGRQWRKWAYVDTHTQSFPDRMLAKLGLGRVRHMDQLQQVIDNIEFVRDDGEAKPRRRLIVSAWNPPDVPYMGLPPCHTLWQCNVSPATNTLSLQLYARSIDSFLGLPYNIASYAALLIALSALTGLHPGMLKIRFGDLHIYTNHLEQVTEQLSREPLALPTLFFNEARTNLDAIQFEDFALNGYASHLRLKGEVAV